MLLVSKLPRLLEFNNKNITNRFNSYKIHFSANTNRQKSYILPQIYDKTAGFLGFLAIFKQKVQDYCKMRNQSFSFGCFQSDYTKTDAHNTN